MTLRGSLAAGDTYLVKMSGNGPNGAALPAPDRTASPSISMATNGGQVLLLDAAAPFTGRGDLAAPDNQGVIDMVGLDPTASGATSYEGSPAPAPTSTQSAQRDSDGADTDDNSADFALGAPTPEACDCVVAAGSFSGADRRHPGHEHRHHAAAGQDRHHVRGRDRALPERWLQRRLHPDGRHRRGHGRHPQRLGRHLRLRRSRRRDGAR